MRLVTPWFCPAQKLVLENLQAVQIYYERAHLYNKLTTKEIPTAQALVAGPDSKWYSRLFLGYALFSIGHRMRM